MCECVCVCVRVCACMCECVCLCVSEGLWKEEWRVTNSFGERFL